MRVVVAGLLVLTAVGSGAAVYYLPELEPERQLSEITRILTPVPVETGRRPVEDAPQGRTFAPQSPLFARVPTEVAGANGRLAAAADVPVGSVGRAPQPLAKPQAPQVLVEAWRDQPSGAGDDKKRSLVVELQRELKRVGCYSGELNGEWNASVQRSLRQFTDRVNAKLPLEEPDYIQLTLVKGQDAEACGKCPKGQNLADDGRCLPRGVLARATPKSPLNRDETANPADKSKTVAPVQVTAVPEPRVTLVPADRSKKAGEPARTALSSSWTTEVLPLTREVAVLKPAVPGALPLPGRMTLGTGQPAAEAGGLADPRRASVPTLLAPPTRIERKTAALPPVDVGSQPGPEQKEETGIVPPPAQGTRQRGTAPQGRYDLQPAPVKVYRPAPSYSYSPPPVRLAPSRDWKRRVHNNELSSR